MICVIPARGGSKRLPGKNIKELDSLPVIGHVIATARNSKLFDEVYVSTDSTDICVMAMELGAEAVYRPNELCEDDVPDLAVIEYYMRELKPDYLCYLYPTAALTTPEQLIRGLDACRELGGKVGCRVRYNLHSIAGEGRKRGSGMTKAIHGVKDAGQFYWIRGGDPIEDCGYIELDPLECQDVNTAEDWAMLEAKWRMRK